jgi:hypothetical protein
MKYSMKIYVATLVLLMAGAGIIYRWTRPHLSVADLATLRVEMLKTIMQLVAIGIAGGFLAWLLAERSKEREREIGDQKKQEEHEEQRRESERQRLRDQHEAVTAFRREAMDRLVSATNVVRKAPLLIEAHRSKLTYGTALREIVDAKLGLGLLRHQIEDTRRFTAWQEIGEAIAGMEGYLEALIAEWRHEYKQIPSENDGWTMIQRLPVLKDLREAKEQSDFQLVCLSHYQNSLRLMSNDVLGQAQADTADGKYQ